MAGEVVTRWPVPFSPAESDLGQPGYSRAADAIRRDIVADRFADGERLVTTDLAQRYGLSLSPIREALHQLTAEGVVVFEPKRGAVIRAITPAFVRDIYEIRLGLVPFLEGERAAAATDDDAARIEAAERFYEDAVARGDAEAAIRLNAAFHATLLTVRRNREAEQLLRRHDRLIRELRLRHGFLPGRLATAVEEHRRLLHAVRTRSAARMREVSRLHIQHALDELTALCFPGGG